MQILKVIRVHSLLATTPSLHVHIRLYSCAPFTMTFRVGSRAEGNSCDSGVHHVVVAVPPQQPNHWLVSMSRVVEIASLNSS